MGRFAPQSGRNAGKQTAQLNFLHFKELCMKISLINTENAEPSAGAPSATAQQVELSHRLLLSSLQPKANTSFPGGMGSEHRGRKGAVCVQRVVVKMGRQSTGAHWWGSGCTQPTVPWCRCSESKAAPVGAPGWARRTARTLSGRFLPLPRDGGKRCQGKIQDERLIQSSEATLLSSTDCEGWDKHRLDLNGKRRCFNAVCPRILGWTSCMLVSHLQDELQLFGDSTSISRKCSLGSMSEGKQISRNK